MNATVFLFAAGSRFRAIWRLVLATPQGCEIAALRLHGRALPGPRQAPH